MSEQRRITLVNQFFPPDISPTAHLTASLAAHLAARGDEVTVVTGGEGYVKETRGRGAQAVEEVDGVRVVRLWTPALGKSTVAKRLSDYASFLVGATLRLVRLPRQDVVVSLTTPPFVVVSAVAHKLVRRRCRVVLWSMDCYPDVIERLGSRTEGGPVVHVGRRRPAEAAAETLRGWLRPVASLRQGGPLSTGLRAVNRWSFRRLDQVVALDEAMRDLLIGGYGSSDGAHPPSTVIANWEALAAFPPGPPTVTWAGYDDPALADRFVVLYLGNLGYGHRVETVVAAAGRLSADEGVAWLFMGGGVRWEQLAGLAATEGVADRVVRRDYVAKEETRAVMAGAGCALIVLADEALGVMSPSKLHANLAAGLAILYVGPEGSNVDAAIRRFGCGVSLRSGDVEGLANAVRRLRDDRPWRDELSANARRAFEEAYCDRATLPRWDAVIDAP
ncbi:glycosyltransferase family 4 protein [Iamia sp.]|uniref:glycosyltransferase family 4 protein n=1 Tax=Iamia sp. TaxID=2722710 RepID=UPI002CC83A87|nr:glycosyltransferase family 4 protein [Iamia sp.]HXH58343.1 glycosyltransferase family 4 protein [Iamia sp.]